MTDEKELDINAETLLSFGGAVKALGDGVVGGYLVRFGSPEDLDLDGEYFDADTDYGNAQKSAVYYAHGLDDKLKKRTLTEGELDEQDAGIWIEAQLKMRDAYERMIYKLAEMGKLGWSSGTASHLVEKERKKGATYIKKWPLGLDASFVIDPADPINQVIPLKSWSGDPLPEIQEDSERVSISGVEIVAPDTINISYTKDTEVSKMSEKTKETQPETVPVEETPPVESFDAAAFKSELLGEVKGVVEESLKAFRDAPPQVPDTKVTPNAPHVMKAAQIGDPDPDEDFYRYVATGKGRIKKHWNREAELPHQQYNPLTGEYSVKMVKAALQEGTDGEGGYWVPAGELGRIIQKRDESALLSLLGASTFTTDRDVFNIPTEGTALTKFGIVAEEGNVSAAEEEPTATQAAVTIYKFMKVIKMSSEIEEDFNSGMAMFLQDAIGRAWAITENYYIQVGTGSSQPQGAFVGGTAGLTLDSASAIGAAEVPELMGTLEMAYRPGAVLVMARETVAYLAGLRDTSDWSFRTAPVANLAAGAQDLGVGYPVFGTEDAATIAASAKTMLFGNFALYGWVRNRSLRVERMNELYRATDQIGLHCKFRAGGAVLQAEAFQYASHPTA